MSTDTIFGFQNRTVLGPTNIVQGSKDIIINNSGFPALGVAGPNDHYGAMLWDAENEQLIIGTGDLMSAPIPAITIPWHGSAIIPNPSFSGDLDMNGHNILNVNTIHVAAITTTGTTIALTGKLNMITNDIDMLSHDIQHCNAIQVNTSNGGGNVQIHSQGGSAQNNVQVNTAGDLIAHNLTSTFLVGLLRPRYWESAITLGSVQTPLAIVSTVYSLLGSWGTAVGFGWTVDSPVAGSWRLTYNGTSSRVVQLNVDMTYSTSAPDQFEIGFYKNATISGANVISTGPINGSFHRVNNTGLILPRDSFHVMTTVAPNDTFMIGVQCATVAGVVFQAISASWTIEDFSNGTD